MKNLMTHQQALNASEWAIRWLTVGAYNSTKSNRKSKFYSALAADFGRTSKQITIRDSFARFDKNLEGRSLASLEQIKGYLYNLDLKY